MRILHLVQGYYPALGGTEHRVRRLSEVLVRDYRDEVTVLCGDGYNTDAFNLPEAPRIPAGTTMVNGVRVIRGRTIRRPGRLLAALRDECRGTPLAGPLGMIAYGPRLPRLPLVLLGEPWDLVMASSFPCAHLLAASLLCPLAGIPFLLSGAFHPDVPLHEDAFPWRLAARADGYLAHTGYERELAIARGVAPDRVTVIGAGAEADWLAGVDRAACRARLGLPGTVLLFAGQLIPGKGLDLVLAALPRLWARRQDFSLLIAGSAHSGYHHEVRRLIGELPAALQDRIRLVTSYPEEEKRELFAAADLLVFPSAVDSFGIVIVEAWAAGLAVVAGDAPPQRSLLRDGEDAILTPLGDPDALVRSLDRLLASPADRRRLGDAGRARLEREFTWAKIAAAYRACYQATIARRRDRGAGR